MRPHDGSGSLRQGWTPRLATEADRRTHYRENLPYIEATTAELYHALWGDHLHFAIFEPGEAAHQYAVALERTHQRYAAALRLDETMHVLDLGCGSGAFAEWLAERTTGTVLGLDLSSGQVTRARQRLHERPRENLRFRTHDVMELDKLAGAPLFDGAVCLEAACYFPDVAQVLAAVVAHLRPGARVLLVDWCVTEHVMPLQEELMLEPLYRRRGMPRLETAAHYRHAFAAAGFRVLDVDDLSARIAPNWERGHAVAFSALARGPEPPQLLQLTAGALVHDAAGTPLLKEQSTAIFLARAAADAGILRYVLFLAERV